MLFRSACPTAAITYEEVATSDWLADFAAERGQRVLSSPLGGL